MPVTTILRHAIERDTPVTAEAGSDTRMSNNEGSFIPDHTPLESNVDSTERRSPKIPRASKGKKTAVAISSSSSLQPKQPRNASASKYQRKSSSSSTQIAPETNYYTLATEEPLSTETLSLGASFFAPLGMSNGMSNGMFNSTDEMWEPQLTYWHTTAAPLTNWATENPFPNAFTAAEEPYNFYNNYSTTASPSTNQSNSEQRSSFASSAGQISPASYFTTHSSPMGYKPSQTTLEDSATTTARNEHLPDEYHQATYSPQHMNQQAVTSSQEEEGALHQVAAARLAEIPQPVITRQPVPTIGQVPPAQEKVYSKPPTSSPSRPTLRSSSPTHPVPEMNQSSKSPNIGTDMITRSQSRSAAARQRAKSERRRRAASQSAASQNAEGSSVAASVPMASSSQAAAPSRVAVSSESIAPLQAASSSSGAASSSSRAASSFQAASSSSRAASSSSSRAASSSQTAASSQNVPPRENSSRAAEALQGAHQRRLAAEATRQLYASQSTVSPYFTNISQHIPSQSGYPSSFSAPYSFNYHGPSPALSNAQFAHPQFPEPARFPCAQEGAYSYGHAADTMMNSEHVRSEALGSDYGGPRSAAIPIKVDPACQEPHSTSTHQSQPYPSQEIKNEHYASYAEQGSSYGSQGVHDPFGHNGQADDVQVGSREAWQAAKRVYPERRALSRARSMAPPSQQNAAQRLQSYTPSIQGQMPSQRYSYEGSRESLQPNAAQRHQSHTPSIQGQTPSAQRLESSTPGNRRQRLSSADSDEILRNRRRRESRLRTEVANAFEIMTHDYEEAESRAERAETRAQEAQAQVQAQEAQIQAQEAQIQAQEAQAQLRDQATYMYPPTLPVLEPRVRILIPVCVSGASLMPPPNQALEIAFQVQEPKLVEGRGARP